MAPQYFIEEYKSPKTRPVLVEREINLAKWPQIFATRQTAGKSRKIKRGNSEVVIGLQHDNKGNEIEVGFLIVPDYITLLGLIHIWELYDKPAEGSITVKVRAFLSKILQKAPSQRAYDHLEQSLKRLKQVPIRWIRAFYDSRTDRLETITEEEFNFLQYLKLRKVSYEDNSLSFRTFTFRFNSHFLDNLLNQETRPLTLTEIITFQREMSVLAYAFLDLIMAKKKQWERRAFAFLREDLQIAAKRYRWPSRARDEIKAIAAELDGARISSGHLQVRVRKIRNSKEWKIVVSRRPFEQVLEPIQRSESDHNLNPEVQDLIDQMARVLGKREENARFYQRIAQKCPRDLIDTALQDTLSEERAGNITSSKSAFFGYWIQVLASKRGIDLGLKSSFTQILKED